VIAVDIDFTACRTVDEAHVAIGTALNFPQHYGGNLDALWDALTVDIPRPIAVTAIGVGRAKLALGDLIDAILEVFRDAERQDDGLSLRVVE